MKRIGRISFFLGLAFLAQLSGGQTLEMTKIVVRYTSPTIKPDSFQAQPKTLYRVGGKYSRIEETLDTEKNIQTLIITREPDNWKINLANKTGEHMVDPGPTFNSRMPILWSPKAPGQPDWDKDLVSLEFGNEARYFRQNDARHLGTREVDGKQCKASSIKKGAREIVLLTDPDTEKPVEIDVTNNGKPEFAVHYLSYETGLPFDPSLFELPEGLTIAESKPQQASVESSPTASPASTP